MNCWLTSTVTYHIWHDRLCSSSLKENSSRKRHEEKDLQENHFSCQRHEKEGRLQTGQMWQQEEEEGDAYDEERGGGRRKFPGAQVARPGAEQRDMAEEQHMMQRPPLQCHDSEESCTNSLTFTHLTISYCGARLQPTNAFYTRTRMALKTLKHAPALALGGRGFSLCCPGQRCRNMFTWPFHLRDWQSGRWEGAQVLSVEPSGTPGALRTLLTPILSTQLACASLTHARLLMATAS